jgi:hypothetical protein
MLATLRLRRSHEFVLDIPKVLRISSASFFSKDRMT